LTREVEETFPNWKDIFDSLYGKESDLDFKEICPDLNKKNEREEVWNSGVWTGNLAY
jgi:hypothetical protein